MGPRLLCFASGAASTAFFVHLGLLATPFFGSGAFLWANVFACFLLAQALGHGLGEIIVSAFGEKRLEGAAPVLAMAGGATAWLASYTSPDVFRWILDGDPTWRLAPAAGIACVALVPGTIISGVVPSELRSRLDDCETPRAGARVTLRLLGLTCLGGAAGILLSGKPLLHADEVDVWLHAYGVGALLLLLGLAFVRWPVKIVGVVVLGALVALSATRPSEAQSDTFAAALSTSWSEGQGTGIYYRLFTDENIGDAELAALVEEANTEKPGIILTLEVMEGLELGKCPGDSLLHILNLLLPPEAKTTMLPFFRNLDFIRSDGKGTFFCSVKQQPGKRGAEFEIPGAKPGETIRFWYKDDFTIRMTHKGTTWKLEFGPLTTQAAGFLEWNDSYSTPLRVPDVAFFIDASVLAIEIDDLPDQVVVKAVAQASVGDVRTQVVTSIKKERKGKQDAK